MERAQKVEGALSTTVPQNDVLSFEASILITLEERNMNRASYNYPVQHTTKIRVPLTDALSTFDNVGT